MRIEKKLGSVIVLYFVFAVMRAGALKQEEENSKAARKARKAELELGALFYSKYSCKSCHGPQGIAQGDLRKAYKKFSDEQLKAYIKSPSGYGNSKMPAFSGIIADAEYEPLIAYVKWLGQEAEKKKKK